MRADAEAVARQRHLITSCQGMVRAVAWKIHCKLPSQVELEDLISYGQVGLAQAAKEFDPSRGAQFSTYAYHRIRGAIFDGLGQMAWFNQRDYHSDRYEHMQQIPTPEATEPAEPPPPERMGLGEMEQGGHSIEDESAHPPENGIMDQELAQRLEKLINDLPPEEGQLIRGAYFEGKTLQEIGQHLGISKAWASRLNARALERLARSLSRTGTI